LYGRRVPPEVAEDVATPRRVVLDALASLLVLAPALAAALAAIAGTIGADSRWLAALGRSIVAERAIPDGVPFATAPSAGWPNVPVLAELVFDGLHRAFGERGFQLAQVLAVAAAFALLALGARRSGAGEGGTALVLMVAIAGSLSALVVARVQLFSLALFPLLLLLLRAEARAPSRRIWLLVPLVALWSNLHGAVLVGIAVAGAYLVVDRVRRQPWMVAGVLVALVPALCLTPALWRTPDYYLGVLGNEAARRGVGLWARLSPTAPLDVLVIASAVALVVLAVRARPPLWEFVALAGLAIVTVQAARSGVWLLFLAAAPAARSLASARPPRHVVLVPVLVAAAAVAAIGLVRGPLRIGATDDLVSRTIADARGGPVLAEPLLAEQVVLAGGRVWLSNPIDAFDHADQRLYLDWVEAEPSGDAALRHARVVLVEVDGDADRRLAKRRTFRRVASDDDAALYARTP